MVVFIIVYIAAVIAVLDVSYIVLMKEITALQSVQASQESLSSPPSGPLK